VNILGDFMEIEYFKRGVPPPVAKHRLQAFLWKGVDNHRYKKGAVYYYNQDEATMTSEYSTPDKVSWVPSSANWQSSPHLDRYIEVQKEDTTDCSHVLDPVAPGKLKIFRNRLTEADIQKKDTTMKFKTETKTHIEINIGKNVERHTLEDMSAISLDHEIERISQAIEDIKAVRDRGEKSAKLKKVYDLDIASFKKLRDVYETRFIELKTAEHSDDI